jgi:hypothetical protein
VVISFDFAPSCLETLKAAEVVPPFSSASPSGDKERAANAVRLSPGGNGGLCIENPHSTPGRQAILFSIANNLQAMELSWQEKR